MTADEPDALMVARARAGDVEQRPVDHAGRERRDGAAAVGERPVDHAGRERRWDVAAAAAVLGGFLAMHLPVALHYLAHGQLTALLTGYAFNPWGLAYITQRGAAGPLAELWEGAAATVHTLALPLALAGFAVARRLALRTGPSGQDPADRSGWL